MKYKTYRKEEIVFKSPWEEEARQKKKEVPKKKVWEEPKVKPFDCPCLGSDIECKKTQKDKVKNVICKKGRGCPHFIVSVEEQIKAQSVSLSDGTKIHNI